jgi:hypothetical protein
MAVMEKQSHPAGSPRPPASPGCYRERDRASGDRNGSARRRVFPQRFCRRGFSTRRRRSARSVFRRTPVQPREPAGASRDNREFSTTRNPSHTSIPQHAGTVQQLCSPPAVSGVPPGWGATWRRASLPAVEGWHPCRPDETLEIQDDSRTWTAYRCACGSFRRAGKPGSTAGTDARRAIPQGAVFCRKSLFPPGKMHRLYGRHGCPPPPRKPKDAGRTKIGFGQPLSALSGVWCPPFRVTRRPNTLTKAWTPNGSHWRNSGNNFDPTRNFPYSAV